jgi:uncharacterized protein YjbI with pentapeptide repeats
MAEFKREDFSGSRFERVDLSSSTFIGVDFARADFRVIDMTGAVKGPADQVGVGLPSGRKEERGGVRQVGAGGI